MLPQLERHGTDQGIRHRSRAGFGRRGQFDPIARSRFVWRIEAIHLAERFDPMSDGFWAIPSQKPIADRRLHHFSGNRPTRQPVEERHPRLEMGSFGLRTSPALSRFQVTGDVPNKTSEFLWRFGLSEFSLAEVFERLNRCVEREGLFAWNPAIVPADDVVVLALVDTSCQGSPSHAASISFCGASWLSARPLPRPSLSGRNSPSPKSASCR